MAGWAGLHRPGVTPGEALTASRPVAQNRIQIPCCARQGVGSVVPAHALATWNFLLLLSAHLLPTPGPETPAPHPVPSLPGTWCPPATCLWLAPCSLSHQTLHTVAISVSPMDLPAPSPPTTGPGAQ